jgi:hypothetical protein
MSQEITKGQWPWLLYRYAWTRPLWVRVVGVLAIGYTIVVAVDGGYALSRWLFGLLFGLVGWALIANSRRLSAADLEAVRRNARFDPFGHLPLGAARRVMAVAGALLATAGIALGVSSVFAL